MSTAWHASKRNSDDAKLLNIDTPDFMPDVCPVAIHPTNPRLGPAVV